MIIAFFPCNEIDWFLHYSLKDISWLLQLLVTKVIGGVFYKDVITQMFSDPILYRSIAYASKNDRNIKAHVILVQFLKELDACLHWLWSNFMAMEIQEKTTFITKWGIYIIIVMMFGLKTTSTMF